MANCLQRPICINPVFFYTFHILKPTTVNKQNQGTNSYRWAILIFYSLITIIIEIQWLTFASISEAAKSFYQATNLGIDFLSIIYMIVFILLSIPASYIIDTYGLKKGLLIGAWLTGIFGLLKAIGANNYYVVLLAQTGLAVAQPFILNALTKMGAKWFPHNERATVAGIGTLAQYIGIIIALAATPYLINENTEGLGISRMLFIYGILSVISAALVVLFVKDPPETSYINENPDLRISPRQSIIYILKNKDMQFLIILFFIGLGIFNAISTCINQITPKLSAEQSGLVGGIMLIGGILGALVLPYWSDKRKERRPFIIICMLLLTPGIIGLTIFHGFVPLLISSFVFGFFIMSAGPIGFQYGAEVSFPATESISQGILLLAGQISGILFVYGFDLIGATTTMVIFIILALANIAISFGLKESYNKII